MVNISKAYNSGSAYEQLISQVMTIESQPRLKLKQQQSDQSVYKGVLSDFNSRASALSAALEKLQDPRRAAFSARAATVSAGAGFTAKASDTASAGTHEIQTTRLARADSRLSKRLDDAGTEMASQFLNPAERSFTVHVAQFGAEPVALNVTYAPPEGATDGDVLAGIAAAINDAATAARADGRLGEGTGVSASVVHETNGTSRLSLKSLATGYSNRLTFTDTDGLLGALEVDRTSVRSGTGGGAVVAVGSGPEDSQLTAAFTLDGLEMVRDSNTVSDALTGLTLTLAKTDDAPQTLTVGADAKGMRSEVEVFVKAYNDLASFLTTKTKVDPDAGTRGAFAGDAAATGLRNGLRTDLARAFGGAISSLTDIGITTERDGTLTVSDGAALDKALASSPAHVGALFGGADGVAARLSPRLDGLLGSSGTIAQRKKTADDRIRRFDGQIARLNTRLEKREASLRSQFEQLQAIATRAQGQQASLNALFYY